MIHGNTSAYSSVDKPDNNGWPRPDGVMAILAQWKGGRAYIVPSTDSRGKLLGNNGDMLLHRIASMMISSAGLSIVSRMDEADVFIVLPGGGLREVYQFPHLLAQRLAPHPNVPTVLLPQSLEFHTLDPSFMFANRKAPTYLFVRDAFSYRNGSDKWGESLAGVGCLVLLDHDVVASNAWYVSSSFGKVVPGTPLVAARKDMESSSYRRQHESASRSAATTTAVKSMKKVAEYVPYGRIYTGIARTVRHQAQRRAGAELVKALDEQNRLLFSGQRVMHRDVSSVEQCTYNQYQKVIREAGPVVTNRLHVALPAAALGKQVFLVEGGYFKARGVFEQSLSSVPNIELVIPSNSVEE